MEKGSSSRVFNPTHIKEQGKKMLNDTWGEALPVPFNLSFSLT